MDSLIVVKKEKQEIDYYEPMDTSEGNLDAYCEEGEINSSDDDKNDVRYTQSNVPSIFTRNNSKFQDIRSIDENSRKLDRAKRFALALPDNTSQESEMEQILNLHKDLGIDKENERHYRFNVIHMRGTEHMSTEDVFQYFTLYSPSHIEWINDVSCNIVWMDDVSAGRALLKLSKKIKNLEKVHLNADPFEKDFKEIDMAEDDVSDDNSVDARQIKAAIPPGFWRIGVSTEKSPCVLLRYATRSDKKQRYAERNSEYYKKYGNPHYGNLPGIFTKSLRNTSRKNKRRIQDTIRNSIQEDLNEKKNPWKELAYEWGRADKLEDENLLYGRDEISTRSMTPTINVSIPDLRISLRNKEERRKRMYMNYDVETSQNSSSRDNWETRIKVPRMKMYADDEEKRIEKNLDRKTLTKKFRSHPVEDLRSKINRKKNRPRFKFRVEKKKRVQASETESTNSENDDGDSGNWALEEYNDLRKSLRENKRYKQNSDKTQYSESENDDTDVDDTIHKNSISRRSPLQIEIDNDEYYGNK